MGRDLCICSWPVRLPGCIRKLPGPDQQTHATHHKRRDGCLTHITERVRRFHFLFSAISQMASLMTERTLFFNFIPKGLDHSAQGCEARATLGNDREATNPERVAFRRILVGIVSSLLKNC